MASPRGDGMWWARSVTGSRAWIAYIGAAMVAGGGFLVVGYAMVRFPYRPEVPEQVAPRWIEAGIGLLVVGALMVVSAHLSSPRWEPGLPVASMSRRGELFVGIVAVAALLVVAVASPQSELRSGPIAIAAVLTVFGGWTFLRDRS